MTDKDIRALLWLLEEINNDKMIASYFRQELNHRYTDIAKLIGNFKDIVKMLNEPRMNKAGMEMVAVLKIDKGSK